MDLRRSFSTNLSVVSPRRRSLPIGSSPGLGPTARLPKQALYLSEGRRRAGRDRLHHFRIASGSLDEAITALRVGEALGYLGESTVEEPLRLLDRLAAMVWALVH